MLGSKTVRISFTVNVQLEDRDDHWAAYIEPLGMTVYGDTENDAINRVQQAMSFFMDNFGSGSDGVQKVRRYLDSHGVASQVTEDDMVKRIQYPVNFPLEAAVSA